MATRGFINQSYLAELGLPVGNLTLGQPFTPGNDVIVHLDRREAGCWPSTIWRVEIQAGEDESLGIVRRRTVTPLQRLEPWETFGHRGREVMAIIERLDRLDGAEIDAIEARLADEPALTEHAGRPHRVPLTGSAHIVSAVEYACIRRAREIDPAALVEDDFLLPPRLTWARPVWRVIEEAAYDAATAIALGADEDASPAAGRFASLMV